MAGLTNYFHEVLTELRKVSWPSRQVTLNMTGLVIAVSLLVSVYLGSLDLLFGQMLAMLIK